MSNAQNSLVNAEYVEPKTFAELSERDQLWQFQSYLGTLLELQKHGVEAKREISATMAAINRIMGI